MNENNNEIPKGKLEFKECYSLYKFIKAIYSLADEIPVILDSYNNQLIIRFMDASRICLIETTFNNLSIKPTNMYNLKTFLNIRENIKKEDDITPNYNINIESDGKQIIDAEYLKNLLKVKKTDEKNVSIVFEDSYILIEKRSDYLGVVKKKLEYTKIDFNDISMGSLYSIEYPSTIEISQKLLNDFFNEAGIYSEIIGIEINQKGIYFTEKSNKGDSNIFYESKLLNNHSISTKSEKGMYSLSFLNLVKPIINIMEEKDTIKIELKSNNPLKVSIFFDKIGAKIAYYLADRVAEDEKEND